ncbi:uncharacterized protein LOC107873286 [Capsicum annuum]|uniref:uncharacterized protein LOC107873286 n=1 Tax=Capsicum annuum TaxID=4072 RepID=UPI0007BEB64D|nr:uncharacterized protein LOC107873286 [Capsicum annuum]XP_047270835.1 uncharacterized protein LOC107873286 [Capsicum annuum]
MREGPGPYSKVHKITLPKEDSTRTPHEYKIDGLDTFLFKESKGDEDLTRKRTQTKLLWFDRYFKTRSKASNPMDRRKEFSTKGIPTKRQKDQTYFSQGFETRAPSWQQW